MRTCRPLTVAQTTTHPSHAEATMYATSLENTYRTDRYQELAARIEWEEQGSLERPRHAESAGEPTRR